MAEFIRILLTASEKAANIARAIRREEELFKLLIEEKETLKWNESVFRDFKTLADVLIQETVRHDISTVFPEMEQNIFGEESNLFTNSNGESITITVGPNEDETRRILEKVLPHHVNAALLLAQEVHREVVIPDEEELRKIPCDLIGPYSNLGIWIDPIDATKEYIKGKNVPSDYSIQDRILSEGGLACVTVLIGVFDLTTGSPMIGIINQPFYNFSTSDQTYKGRCFWGISVKSYSSSNVSKFCPSCTSHSPPVIIMSELEEPSLIQKLEPNFKLTTSPGAGYKLLCVILGLADFYVLSRSSTHFWDTCAPNAILNAIGGGIDSFDKLIENPEGPVEEISYKPNAEKKAVKYANVGGLIAYRKSEKLSSLLNALK